MLDFPRNVKKVVVYFLSLGLVRVLEVQFGKRKCFKKRVEVNIHSHCTAFRDDNTRNKIIVTVLSWLNKKGSVFFAAKMAAAKGLVKRKYSK